jgi:hypothetical protein
MTRQQLLQELAQLQDEWPHQDIITITGFMVDDEIAQHVARYRALVVTHRAA